MSEMKTKGCRKVSVVTDCEIVVTPGTLTWRYRDETEDEYVKRREKAFERWAKELREFVRDHRSMDVNAIEARNVTEDRCSACGGGPWEITTYDADGDDPAYIGCAHCGERIES